MGLIINSGYTGRLVEKDDEDMDHFFDYVSVGIGLADENSDLRKNDAKKSNITRFKRRGAILIYDRCGRQQSGWILQHDLWEKKGLTKISDCDDFDDITEIITSEGSGSIVFHCHNIKRALEICEALKELRFCNWSSIYNMKAIELSSGKKAMIFVIDAESG